MSLLPSQFVEEAILVRGDGGILIPFSYDERPYLRRIYDTRSRRTLLKCGRQVEKSTSLGNRALAYCCLRAGWRVIYVSPSHTQTKEFSTDRLKEPIETCPVVSAYTDPKLSMSVLSKEFRNRAKITLRYAFLNADRTRGIPADQVLIDEFQDILLDLVPVIEQCAAHGVGLFGYSGTPLTLDNSLSQYWDYMSTQNEWVVPCFRHMRPDPASARMLPYWNILGEDNIGIKGPICDKCGSPIYPNHPDAMWAAMRPNPPVPIPFEGYHISQLMVPWVLNKAEKWKELLHSYETYSRQRFFNEILGEPYDSGNRPLVKEEIERCCVPEVHDEAWKFMMDDRALAFWVEWSRTHPVWAGIDWGTGDKNSYTLLTLSTYWNGRWTVFYAKRYIGPESEPEPMLDSVSKYFQRYSIKLAGTDYGGGWIQNDKLIRRFGLPRVAKYQYAGTKGKICQWDDGERLWKGNRTAMLSAVFNTIKRESMWLPCWTVFEDPFSRDLLSVFAEYSEKQRMTLYDHRMGTSDDTLHSIVLNLFASMLHHPRPDILAPVQEEMGIAGISS